MTHPKPQQLIILEPITALIQSTSVYSTYHHHRCHYSGPCSSFGFLFRCDAGAFSRHLGLGRDPGSGNSRPCPGPYQDSSLSCGQASCVESEKNGRRL